MLLLLLLLLLISLSADACRKRQNLVMPYGFHYECRPGLPGCPCRDASAEPCTKNTTCIEGYCVLPPFCSFGELGCECYTVGTACKTPNSACTKDRLCAFSDLDACEAGALGCRCDEHSRCAFPARCHDDTHLCVHQQLPSDAEHGGAPGARCDPCDESCWIGLRCAGTHERRCRYCEGETGCACGPDGYCDHSPRFVELATQTSECRRGGSAAHGAFWYLTHSTWNVELRVRFYATESPAAENAPPRGCGSLVPCRDDIPAADCGGCGSLAEQGYTLVTDPSRPLRCGEQYWLALEVLNQKTGALLSWDELLLEHGRKLHVIIAGKAPAHLSLRHIHPTDYLAENATLLPSATTFYVPFYTTTSTLARVAVDLVQRATADSPVTKASALISDEFSVECLTPAQSALPPAPLRHVSDGQPLLEINAQRLWAPGDRYTAEITNSESECRGDDSKCVPVQVRVVGEAMRVGQCLTLRYDVVATATAADDDDRYAIVPFLDAPVHLTAIHVNSTLVLHAHGHASSKDAKDFGCFNPHIDYAGPVPLPSRSLWVNVALVAEGRWHLVAQFNIVDKHSNVTELLSPAVMLDVQPPDENQRTGDRFIDEAMERGICRLVDHDPSPPSHAAAAVAAAIMPRQQQHDHAPYLVAMTVVGVLLMLCALHKCYRSTKAS